METGSFVYNRNVNKHSLTQQLSLVISAIFYPGAQRHQSNPEPATGPEATFSES